MFYVKRMQPAEWASYQADFETLFVTLNGPRDMALLVWTDRNNAGDDRIAITEDNFAAAQALSPGGWERVDQLEMGWVFLIGHPETFERLGAAIGELP